MFICLGAALVILGCALYMITYPSIDWIMAHTLEEWMIRNNQSMTLALWPAGIGAIINLYGLYLVFVKEE